MSENGRRSDNTLIEWLGRILLLGIGAAMVVPMGEGDPEHGFFFVAAFAADLWLVQWVVAVYENRKHLRVLLDPLRLIKGIAIVAIVVAAAVRGRLSEVAAMSLAAGFFFGLLALGAVAVFSVKRVWAERKRH